MKVVITHTDFRIYWPARIFALHQFLQAKQISLEVVEIAGAGSPYHFAGKSDFHLDWWHCLFPIQKMEEIEPIVANKALRKKLDHINPDVVIAGAIAFPSGAAAVRWAAENKKKVIIFDDARPEDVKRNWLINAIKKIIYHNVDAILCPAPSHATGFIKWGFKNEEIFYGVDVVDNELFGIIDSGIHEHTETDEILQPYLLAVGRQIEKKNWIDLIRAFVIYKKANIESSLNLVFIGDGPLHHSLVEVSESEQRQDIIFIPFVLQYVLVQYYHQARGLILPSRYGETWGLVVNEAMAAGLPVLVSRECGCAQTLVREGINGWTFDPNNLKEMSDAIKKLDQLSPQQWENMSLSSAEIIKDWDLSRFSRGVIDALLYVSTRHKIKVGWLGTILLKFWNGRYRPV